MTDATHVLSCVPVDHGGDIITGSAQLIRGGTVEMRPLTTEQVEELADHLEASGGSQ